MERRRGEKGWKGKEIKGEWQMEGRGTGKGGEVRRDGRERKEGENGRWREEGKEKKES
jgi:hypothetical protein